MNESSETPDSIHRGANSADETLVLQREARQTGIRQEEDDPADLLHGARQKSGNLQPPLHLASDVLQRPYLHQIDVIVHNNPSESLKDVIINWFTKVEPGLSVERVKQDKSFLISNGDSVVRYTLNSDETPGQESNTTGTWENLEQSWCEFVSDNDCRHLWLEVKRPPSPRALSSPKNNVDMISMSLGSFPSTGKYCRHWNSGMPCPELKIVACLEYDLEMATIIYHDNRRGKWKLEMPFDHLEKFLLVTPRRSGCHVYLFQKYPFKILQEIDSLLYLGPSKDNIIDKEFPETEFLWKRQVFFADCPTNVIGSSHVVNLKFGNSETQLKDALSRFARLGFSIITGHPLVENVSSSTPVAWPRFESFQLTYVWYCLLSRGFKVTDQVTEEFVASINKTQHESWFEATIRAVTDVIDNNSICNLKNQFEEESKEIKRKILAGKIDEEEDGFPIPHVVAIRRLILTPTTIKGLGEEWTVDNRVLRQFGADRFVRISFRDEDFTRLTGYIPIQEVTNRVIEFLKNGFNIGNQRHYQFLGCSNSQLRSHSVWMYASDGQNTVDSIRKWMGDISHEKCVATYVSRLGQCFTTTRKTVEVENFERIEDIYRDTKYCFTDGIGRISTTLANRVKEKLNLPYTPSAFQIRFGGCKGVVAIAPDIGEEKLQIRKSMEKFSSAHNHIEVAETARPVRLSLNRQAIILLSGLGVPDESFFKLQDRMLENMANILVDEATAATEIAKAHHLGIELNELKNSGFAVTLEPFLREVLSTIYRQRFNSLLRRTHIEIPEDKGRMMMGTVDEFDCLEYGEVFVQFSKDIDKPMHDKVALSGNVVVTKSPCFHPGDMRTFMAVDKAELHHMVDCIVFPAKGPRPHPNEMSGSDLDGDLYFVCWEESLIPPNENKQPMDFTPKDKQDLSKPVTESDMITFIGNYIKSDQLGVIANAHLVHADSKDVHCDQCIQIAQTHSDAVDFPKTGQEQKLPKNLHPASYPDYMMKTDKPSYISDTVIGQLFHQCRAIELSNEFRRIEPILIDPDLILPGHEAYLSGATTIKAIYDRKIDELKTMFGIATEVELFSVGVLEVKEGLGHLKGDHYAIREMINIRLDAIKTRMKDMFYGERDGSNDEQNTNLLLLKASALYTVSYSSPEQDLVNSSPDNCLSFKNQPVTVDKQEEARNSKSTGEMRQGEPHRLSLGLPWIFWHLLCTIKKGRPTVSSTFWESRGTDVRPISFLHKLSIEIAEQSEPSLLPERLHSWNSEFDSMKRVQLICFGSAITACATDTTSLEVLALSESSKQPLIEIADELAKLVGGSLMRDYGLKSKNKVNIVNIPGLVSEITLYSDKKCLRRTAYIVAAITLNKWTIPVLRVVIKWGMNCRIADSSRDSILTVEELAIMFYHAIMNGINYGKPIKDEHLNKATLLIMQNHFQTCNLFQCTHLQIDSIGADGRSITHQSRELPEGPGVAAVHPGWTSDMEKAETHFGLTLLGFFRFFGTSRGSNLKEIPDPGQSTEKPCLLNLKDEQYVQVGDQMMEAYHSLANCTSIDDFFSPNCPEDRRFTMILPNEVSSLFRFMEAKWIKTLKRESGASVVFIRKKNFRRFPSGHIIEAWGNATAIKRLSARVQRIIGSAACFTEGKIARDRWLISGAYKTTFDGIRKPDATLVMARYNGRCQDWHNETWKQMPLIPSIYGSDDYNVSLVISYFEEQRKFIRKNYEPDIHGKIRVTISFGNLYTTGFRCGPITAIALSKMLSKRPRCEKSAHINSHIRSPANYRQQGPRPRKHAVCEHSKNDLKNFVPHARMPTSETFSTTSPPVADVHGTFSTCRFESDSTRNSKPATDTNSCGIVTKHIPSDSCNDSDRHFAGNICSHSGLHPSGATGHSISSQNSKLNDSSVGPVICSTPQHFSECVVEDVEHRTIAGHGNTQTSASENVPPVYKTPLPKKDSTFLPMNDLNLDRFNDFCKLHNFVETGQLKEYRATIDHEVSYADIALDEDFALTTFRLQDIKWFVLNVARGRVGRQFIDNQAKDIRIQMRSRPCITAGELAEREGCQDLLGNAGRLLHKNSCGEVDGIALHGYKELIQYMRYKHRTSYQFRGRRANQSRYGEDSFLNRFTLKLNRGKEYRLPIDGIFSQITDQTELMLETDLPNLNNEEECNEFMREIYAFSKYFARQVID